MVIRSYTSRKLNMTLGQLTTFDLEILMSDTPNFIGVFSIDTLPAYLDRSKTIKLIVNLQPRHLPGNHWIAIYRKNGRGFYFGSYGRAPPPTIANWLSQNSNKWTFYDKIIQSPNDKVSCGYICMQFLKKLI